jgi:GNAT superfamily N-acetyltransferase
LRTLPADLTVRPAARDDVDGIAEVIVAGDETYREWAPPTWTGPDPARERAQLRSRIAEPGRWMEVVVDSDGAIVAMVSWTPALDDGEPAPGTAHVGSVFVHPRRWREGIAAVLLERAEASMRAAGFTRARLSTPAGSPARAVYGALGWREDGRDEFSEKYGLQLVGYAKAL